MTDVNHRRKNKPAVNQRHTIYNNGYAAPDNKAHLSEVQKAIDQQKSHYESIGMGHVIFPKAHTGSQRIGRTDYLDKSLHGWGRVSQLADKLIGASIGNDFSNGHRGMAKSVAGAKKFVRTRIRFQENAATKKLTTQNKEE